MTRLLTAIIIPIFMLVILGANGDKKVVKRDAPDDIIQWLCQNFPVLQSMPICEGVTTDTTSTSTPSSSTTEVVDFSSTTSTSFVLETTTVSGNDVNTSSSVSTLQRAHWCSFRNGSYLPLGSTFMNSTCEICQCTQSQVIRCGTFQCKKTYCIDDSTPSVREGQCCTQCAYETKSDSCVYGGITFPTGVVISSTADNLQCWCQLGSVECRKYMGSVFSGLDLWGPGTAVYVIVIIICVFLLFGTILCCGCTTFFYYYYKRNQTVQAAYDQYMSNAGWQPVVEEEQVNEASAEDKEAEAEQSQYANEYPTGNSQEYIPPPYALYNGSYPSEKEEKDQKYM